MAVFPSSPGLQYPITRRLEFQTRSVTGDNGTEQRWPLTVGQESFALSYQRISLTDRNVLQAFFDAAKGAAAQDIEFTLGVDTFSNCYFDADKLAAVESFNGHWAVQLTLKQLPVTSDLDALDADFPVLTSGNRMQLPYTKERNFDSIVVKTEGGRFTYSKRAAVLRQWAAGGSSLSDTEAQNIYNHFARARGRWAAFHFTDPDSGVEATSCRFASDVLEWVYAGPNENSVNVQIVEIP